MCRLKSWASCIRLQRAPRITGMDMRRYSWSLPSTCRVRRGCAPLQLDTFVDNVRSHGLYDKLGFINHGAWPVYYDDLGTVDLDMFEYVL